MTHCHIISRSVALSSAASHGQRHTDRGLFPGYQTPVRCGGSIVPKKGPRSKNALTLATHFRLSVRSNDDECQENLDCGCDSAGRYSEPDNQQFVRATPSAPKRNLDIARPASR